MTRIGLATAVFAASVAFAAAAEAGQMLIPTPYPTGVSGAEPLDPVDQALGGPERLIRDPYPQITGANSQGNPKIVRFHRHQRLIESPDQRKYGVDRLPLYPAY